MPSHFSFPRWVKVLSFSSVSVSHVDVRYHLSYFKYNLSTFLNAKSVMDIDTGVLNWFLGSSFVFAMSSVSSVKTKCDILVFVMCSSYPVYIIILIVSMAVPAVAVIVYLYSPVCLLARVLIQDSNREYLHTGACGFGFCLSASVYSQFLSCTVISKVTVEEICKAETVCKRIEANKKGIV